MERRHEKIYSHALNREMDVLAFGHYGDPIIAFPSGGGQFYDFENNDMISAIRPLIEAGKIKVYCPASVDNDSWLNSQMDVYWRGATYNGYQNFLLENLVPTIRFDCKSVDIKIGLVGCSLGAYHAVNFSLKFPHIFNYALGMSGRYDLEKIIGFSTGDEGVYFNNPVAYTANLNGDPLNHVRHHAHISLVCGQGAWEDKCLDETHRLANLLEEKGIRHERDIWGHDVEHHWFWWRQQIQLHLGKRYG
ncbi:MAG: alpha/beta hydrolase-fold protein [Chloroflexota bacterium]